MDENIKKLLDKINMDENSYPYFNDAKMTKIKVNQKQNAWLIFISKDSLLPIEILEELESKKMNLDEKASNIDFTFDIKNLPKLLQIYIRPIKRRFKSIRNI